MSTHPAQALQGGNSGLAAAAVRVLAGILLNHVADPAILDAAGACLCKGCHTVLLNL